MSIINREKNEKFDREIVNGHERTNQGKDHSKCVRALPNKLKTDHDANLIDGEGDPLEEFEFNDPRYENLVDHSKCTLAWTEDWEEFGEFEMNEVINLPRK